MSQVTKTPRGGRGAATGERRFWNTPEQPNTHRIRSGELKRGKEFTTDAEKNVKREVFQKLGFN